MPRARDRRITGRLCAWFEREGRILPWRTPAVRSARRGERRDPYRALVSEAMLQQTQVARVIERFGSFVARFPGIRALAAASEHDVLAEWSGLGYYRRARNLHAAAKAIVRDHRGRMPSDVEQLQELPGMGPYTAGAIASMVFGRRVPAVDGNVHRVLLRLEGRDVHETESRRTAWVWSRAGELVRGASDPGDLNEGLMELGALVCTPRSPRCEECPLARECVAYRRGIAHQLPPPKRRPGVRPTVFHAIAVLRDRADRVAMVRREQPGLWQGLWQPPGVERTDRPPTGPELAGALGAGNLVFRGGFQFLTTHRVVEFLVWEGRAPSRGRRGIARFLKASEWRSLPLASPHRRILEGESPTKSG